MYLSIYMYIIIFFSSFANSSTDIMHLNQHARPGVTAYVGIDNKRMKYVNIRFSSQIFRRALILGQKSKIITFYPKISFKGTFYHISI